MTPAVLAAVTQSQSHVSATPTPDTTVPPAGVPLASQEISDTSHAPAMEKYYAPVPCPPLPALPSRSSTFTWPDSLVDVVVAPVPPLVSKSPQPTPPDAPEPAAEPLFFSPSPPFITAPPLPLTRDTPAHVPMDSTAGRALSSMALGRTLAEDLMDIEAGIPLPTLASPMLRNPLLEDADEIDAILFSHIKPLQGAALIRAAGVLPEELLSRPSAAGPVPAAPAPERAAPTQASSAPTQGPSYIVEPPADSYLDHSLSEKLAHLAGLFPSISSEMFTIVLGKVDGDLSAASSWVQSVSDVTKAKEVLAKAFPKAPVKEVESSLRHYRGDFLPSFYGLARTFEHTAEWNDLKGARSRGVMDIDDPAPDFLYDDPATEAYEWQWWQVAVSIRSHRVADDPVTVDMWNQLAGISAATREVTPRFVEYVYKLGTRNTAEADFFSAVKTLRAQPDFKAIETIAGPATPCDPDSPRDAATVVLQVLLSDGYISPPAAAWLAIRVSGSPSLYIAMAPLFLAYPKTRGKLWNDRNLHLAAWSITNMKHRAGTNSPTGSRISAADARSAYSNVVPSAKGKEVHPLFSKGAKGKVPTKVKSVAQKKDEKEKKRKAVISAARLAKKGDDIVDQIASERALMEEERESEE